MDATNNNARVIPSIAEWREKAKAQGDTQGANVADFQEKIGAPDPINIEQVVYYLEAENEINQALTDVAADFAVSYSMLADLRRMYPDDGRILRAELMSEEVHELMTALATRDENGVADANADIQFVAIGSNIAFDLPNKSPFDEVVKSNLTKTTAIGAIGNGTEDRGKGEGYYAPNINGAITDWRNDADANADKTKN